MFSSHAGKIEILLGLSSRIGKFLTLNYKVKLFLPYLKNTESIETAYLLTGNWRLVLLQCKKHAQRVY
jgi:hypothetical protein